MGAPLPGPKGHGKLRDDTNGQTGAGLGTLVTPNLPTNTRQGPPKLCNHHGANRSFMSTQKLSQNGLFRKKTPKEVKP